MKKILVIFISLFIVFLFSCRTTKFQGSTNEKGAVVAVGITCSKDQLNPSITKTISNRFGTKTTVSGKICLNGKTTKLQGEANILFIVDTSNSMEYADPYQYQNQACARQQAVETVVSLTTGGINSSNVKGAIVTFGESASSSGWVNLASLSTSGVCNHYTGTNYEAAFNEAKRILAGKSGTNIIYFITDGAPSRRNGSSGNDWAGGQAGGIEAMNNLKGAVSNLTINALYLVDPKLNTYPGGAPTETDTYNYLVNLVGADRVKKATEASQLPTQISSFDTIPAGTFASKDNLKATVTVNSKSRDIKIESFNPVSEGVYEYKLEKVTLKGEYKKTVDNVFKVVGTGSNGVQSSSTVIVKFYQTSNN